jgi:non-ribosomal peptide synthetase component E (peptide arylation enzyme)
VSIGDLIPGWPALRAMRWSDEQAAAYYEAGLWGEGLDRLLAEHARATPERLACTDGATLLTYGELGQRARALAAGLLGYGLGSGDVVLVQMANRTEHVLVLYGLAAAGLIAYELPGDTGAAAVAASARRTRAVALISDHWADDADTVAAAQALSAPALVVRAGANEGGDAHPTLVSLAASSPVQTSGQDPDAVSTLIGTSGTTGTPKIVMRTANGSLAMARAVIAHSGLSGEDVLLVAAPIQGGVGYINAIGSVALTGCTLVIPPDLSPEKLLDLIRARGVTRIATLPTIATRMLSSPAFRAQDVASVEVLQTGGAFLAPEIARSLERAFGCRVIVVYGAIDVGAPTMISTEDPDNRRHSTLGRVVEGAELAILGDGGEHRGIGEIGEVAMRGPDTALGYFADAAATATVFDAQGWGRMGDLGVVDEHGYLRLVGRVKEIINRGGTKISIAEVETAVAAVAGIRDVAAVGYPDPDLGERCAVFVVTDNGASLDLTQLRERLIVLGVPKTIWPERVQSIEALPVSGSGKVNRDELRRQLS